MGTWVLSVLLGTVGGLVLAHVLVRVLDRWALRRFSWYVLPFPSWLLLRPWQWRRFRRFFRQQ